MKYQPFAFWLSFLCLGILVSNYYTLSIHAWSFVAFFGVLLLVLFHYYNQRILFTVLGGVLIAFLGFFVSQKENQGVIRELKPTETAIELRIINSIKSSEKFHRYEAEILNVISPFADKLIGQSVMVSIHKTQKKLLPDDEVWIAGTLSSVSLPLNPNQFNYKQYLLRRKVGLQCYSDTILKQKELNPFSYTRRLVSFKENIKAKFLEKNLSQEARIFISALALGNRDDMTKEWREKLSMAGISHLFAISGLHVGILFSVLLFLLYPLLFLPRGREIRVIIGLLLIWFYAWFVGNSPSVVRAAFMLTFYYTTFLLQKEADVYHTLSVTAFFLLLYNPNYLYDVGFQLSYSSVFFIFWITHKIKVLQLEFKGLKGIVINILKISLAAQVGVLPIIIYYFHQFSWLFIIGNVIFLPLASFLVIVSVLVVGALAMNLWVPLATQVVNFLFSIIYKFIGLGSELPYFVIKNIHWNFLQMILWIIISIGIPYFLIKINHKKLSMLIGLVLLFQLSGLYDDCLSSKKRNLIIFNAYKESIFAYRRGQTLYLFSANKVNEKQKEYLITPFTTQEEIRKVQYLSFQENFQDDVFVKKENVLYFKNTMIIINPQKWPLPEEVNYLWVTNNYRLSGNKLMPAQTLIVDASSYRNAYQDFPSEKVYRTQEKGFFKLE